MTGSAAIYRSVLLYLTAVNIVALRQDPGKDQAVRWAAQRRPWRAARSGARTVMRIVTCGLIVAVLCFVLFPAETCAQGETTSAIVGQVRDSTGAGIPGATVTITNRANGARRTAKTEDEGRFDFPQLMPGAYSVEAEAAGFEPQQNDTVSADLGQKQTIDFQAQGCRGKTDDRSKQRRLRSSIPKTRTLPRIWMRRHWKISRIPAAI